MTDKIRKKAIFGFYLFVSGLGGASCISTVMSLYIAKFSEHSMTTVYQIVTLPALFAMFLSMVAGFIIGRKLSWKNSFLIGTGLYLVGALPLFYTGNLYFLIVCNVIARLGATIGSYRSAAAMQFFGPQDGGKLIAWMATVSSLSIVIIQKFVGWLGTISDNLPWIIYLLGLFSMLSVLFLMKMPGFNELPEKLEQDENSNELKEKEKIKISPYIFIIVPVYLVFSLATQYPIMLGTSQFVASLGLGDTNVAGTIAAFATVATMLTGPTYGIMEKIFKRYLMAIACLFTLAGVWLFTASPSIITCSIGTGLRNYGWALISTAITPYMSSVTRPQEKALMTSIYMVANNIANYVSAYYLAFIGNVFYKGDTVVGPISFGVYVAATVFVLALIIDPRPKAYVEITKVKV